MLLALHFTTPKMLGYLTGGRITRTNKLIERILKIKSTANPEFSVMF